MIETRKATKADIDGVLTLQKQNLYANLSSKERENGFVTTPFTVTQIEAIITLDGLFVAEYKAKIIAYAFAGSWAYFSQWEIFNVMIERFPQLSFNDQVITTANSFQYGPVCISKYHRGKGLLQQLFETMRLVWIQKYPISITFINAINVISEKAHTKKLGWKIIDRFEFNDNQYIGLAFDMNRSVLNQ